MTEACTVADVRLIKWDNYLIVANVFMTRTGWCTTGRRTEPHLAEIVLGSNRSDLALRRLSVANSEPPLARLGGATTVTLCKSDWQADP